MVFGERSLCARHNVFKKPYEDVARSVTVGNSTGQLVIVAVLFYLIRNS